MQTKGGVDDCDEFNDLTDDRTLRVTFNLSRLFQPALLSAQSPLAAEEDEEEHAGHLRFP